MKIATVANSRTDYACTNWLNMGLRVAFSAGSVMGFTVVGFGLLDISVWLFLLRWYIYKIHFGENISYHKKGLKATIILL